MNRGFDALHAALDAAPAPVDFFIRDDDAGWDDARLFALLDVTERHGVPIDLAVIPQATGHPLAASLCLRKSAAPGLLGLHQHGFAHQNHETVERKCEFGSARSLELQRADLRAGREQLSALFGANLDPFFTPPWNRCAAGTAALLAELGFAALSRSRGAPAQQVLPELAIDVDWCKAQRLARSDGAANGSSGIAAQLARCIAAGGPVGLMLHHADMDDTDLTLLDDLLRTAGRHPALRWRPMRALMPVAAPMSIKPTPAAWAEETP